MSDQSKYTISLGKAFFLCVAVAVLTYYATVSGHRFQQAQLAESAPAQATTYGAATAPNVPAEPAPSVEEIPEPPTIARVVEPTILELTDGSMVRLIGVDGPIDEFGKALQSEALAFSKRLVEGKQVRLELEPDLEEDSAGRKFAYVYLEDGTLLNAQIIKKGYGSVSTSYSHHRSREFGRYELQAQKLSLGVWDFSDHSDVEETTETANTSTYTTPPVTVVTPSFAETPIVTPPSGTYVPPTSETDSYSSSTQGSQGPIVPYYVPPSRTYTPGVAENGSYYGELSDKTGRPKTVHVRGYTRRDGTYVRGHYRSAPRRR